MRRNSLDGLRGAVCAAVFLSVSAGALAADMKLAGKTVPVDLNNDGKTDHWKTYDARGVQVLVTKDTNHDGKPDSWLHPVRGMVIFREQDRNFDGRVDDRQTTDFIYDNVLKFSRHLYLWREADDNFDGVVDVYRVRGNKNPTPNHEGQKMDVTPWSEAKEAAAAQEQSKAASEKTASTEQVRQMNARQDLSRS